MALHGTAWHCSIAWHWCMDCAIMRRKSQVLEEYEQQPWTCGELSSLALHLLILNFRWTIIWVCKVLKNKCSRSDGWFLLQLNGFEEQHAGLQSINPKKIRCKLKQWYYDDGKVRGWVQSPFCTFSHEALVQIFEPGWNLCSRQSEPRGSGPISDSTDHDTLRPWRIANVTVHVCWHLLFFPAWWLSRTLVMEGNLGEKSWDLLRVLGMALMLRT